MKNNYYLLFAMIACLMMACEPAVDDKIDIGGTPVPSFEIEQGATPNDFTFRNTTEGAFITKWDFAVGTAVGEIADVSITSKGDYEVTMTTFNKGGSATLTKTLTVTNDLIVMCDGVFEMLTGCDEKVWKLAQEEKAINVGPDLDGSHWGNSTEDLTARECHFNDEYIFRSNGEFEYDNKGDFWADTDGDGNIWPSDLGLGTGCNSSDAWPEKYEAWGSNVHAFNATDNTVTVIGEGAWMGLYKIGTSAEVGTPQSSVVFNISEISSNRMVLFTDYGDIVWRITLESE